MTFVIDKNYPEQLTYKELMSHEINLLLSFLDNFKNRSDYKIIAIRTDYLRLGCILSVFYNNFCIFQECYYYIADYKFLDYLEQKHIQNYHIISVPTLTCNTKIKQNISTWSCTVETLHTIKTEKLYQELSETNFLKTPASEKLGLALKEHRNILIRKRSWVVVSWPRFILNKLIYYIRSDFPYSGIRNKFLIKKEI